jgi:hypothetical protein
MGCPKVLKLKLIGDLAFVNSALLTMRKKKSAMSVAATSIRKRYL